MEYLFDKQDAEELLQILVNLITEELKRPTEHAGMAGLTRAKDIQHPSLGPPPFLNPLAGWLASSLQCCRCQHRRPIRNSAFIDVPLTLPEAQGKEGFGVVGAGPRGLLLNGSAGAHSLPNGGSRVVMNGGMNHKGNSSNSGLACHLMECLKNFATEELVEGVECSNCARLQEVERLDHDIKGVKENIENVRDVMGFEAVRRRFEEELSRLLEEKAELMRPDLDEDRKVNTVRGSAIKRLVFSRLPTILTLHLCRRVSG